MNFLCRAIDRKWLEPYEGVAEFKKRITELKSQEVRHLFLSNTSIGISLVDSAEK